MSSVARSAIRSMTRLAEAGRTRVEKFVLSGRRALDVVFHHVVGDADT
jgi:hypothetical protein